MTSHSNTHRLFASRADLIMPRYCPGCNHRLALEEQPICAECMFNLPWENDYDWIYNPHMAIATDHPCLQCVGALMRYHRGNVAAQIVQSLKFHRNVALASWMGRLAINRLKPTGLFDGIEALVPIPLSSGRLRRRGFNQAQLLAEAMSKELKISVHTDIVKKVKNVEPQTHVTIQERFENLQGAYALTPHADRLMGMHVMLVDDVITTGTTFTTVLTELEKIDNIKISVFAWAWVTK